jgi:transcriptional antiterminator RfaH
VATGEQHWYVLRTKPHKEHQVYGQLAANDVETYFPTITVTPVNPRASRIRPYFPNYMFVHVDLEAVRVSVMQWLPGAVGLVEFGGIPSQVPDNFVHELRRHIAALEAMGGLTFGELKKGDVVKITSGPFAGYEAIFDVRLSGTERVRLLLDVLGRLVNTTVSVSDIEKKRTGPAEPPPRAGSPSRTSGRR